MAFIFSRHQIEELHRKVKKEVGDVSIVINNAGVLYCRPFLQHSAPQIENLIQTNLMGKAKYRSLEIRGEKLHHRSLLIMIILWPSAAFIRST